MDFHHFEAIVNDEMAELCPEYGYKFDNNKRWLGNCNYTTKTLSFSMNLITLNEERECLDTLYHEIAHALVGPKVDAHGYYWQQKAIELGALPRACTSLAIMPEGRYQGKCKCKTHNYYRRPKYLNQYVYTCRLCGVRFKVVDTFSATQKDILQAVEIAELF